MATAAEARWLHQTPEERLGRYIPGRGRDGHMQYVPRSAGDSARLSAEDVERLYHAATRRGRAGAGLGGRLRQAGGLVLAAKDEALFLVPLLPPNANALPHGAHLVLVQA